MKEYCGNLFVRDGEIKPVGEFDNNLVYKGETIYEVIRLVKGIPVFFSDHIERLENSVSLQNKAMIADAGNLKSCIANLTAREKRKEINIKIVFNYNYDKEAETYLIYFIDSVYPTEEQYRRGVKAILFYAERHEPQSKVLNFRLRSEIARQLADEEAYEALLVNNDNLITEGSKSNVFFIKEGKLITAPDEYILKGITRKHILDICTQEGIETEFKCVNADEIADYEAVFMTGTSPMVLPYCCINELHFDVTNPVMGKLRRWYMDKVETSLDSY